MSCIQHLVLKTKTEKIIDSISDNEQRIFIKFAVLMNCSASLTQSNLVKKLDMNTKIQA